MQPLACGCVLVGNGVAYNLCREGHSERRPPPQFRADQSRAEQARTERPTVTCEPLDETLPALQGKRRRQIWDPASGELKDIE